MNHFRETTQNRQSAKWMAIGIILSLFLAPVILKERFLGYPGGVLAVFAAALIALNATLYLSAWLGREKTERSLLNLPILTLLVFILASSWALGAFGQRRHTVGDEPSYLMITHSLAQDLDINMDDDYPAQAYRRFYSGRYPMFTHLGFNGVNYPHHSIGLPILLSPVYALLLAVNHDEIFVPVLRICMAFLFAACFAGSLLITRKIVPDSGLSALTATGVFLSGPLFFFSNEIYPEIPTALLLIFCVYFFIEFEKLSSGRLLLMSAMAGYIPWLGIKYIPTAGILILYAFILLLAGRCWKRLLIFLIPTSISILIYAGFLYGFYRNLNPSVIYTGVIPGTGIANIRPGEVHFWQELPGRLKDTAFFIWGMLIEQRIGVIFFMPLLLFVVPGFGLVRSKNRRISLLVTLLSISHVFLYAWQNNWGGFCPPNRQIVAILPLWVPVIAAGIAGRTGTAAFVFRRFALVYGWFLAVFMVHHERWLYHTMNPHLSGGESQLLRALSIDQLVHFPLLFPLLMGDVKQTLPNLIWTVVFGVITVGIWFSRSKSNIRPAGPLFMNGVLTAIVALCLLHQLFLLPPGTFITAVDNKPYHKMAILDDHHLGNETEGFWIQGKSTSHFVLMFASEPGELVFDLYSLVPGRVSINLGGCRVETETDGVLHQTINLKPLHVFHRGGTEWVKCSVSSSNGIRPSDAMQSEDKRYLGVFVNISSVGINRTNF